LYLVLGSLFFVAGSFAKSNKPITKNKGQSTKLKALPQ
jgi:hypothetical protein